MEGPHSVHELKDEKADVHYRHLCKLVQERQMYTVARLAMGARYICRSCGRAAARDENLCEPVKLELPERPLVDWD